MVEKDNLVNINDMVELVHNMGKAIQPFTYYGEGGLVEQFLKRDDKITWFEFLIEKGIIKQNKN